MENQYSIAIEAEKALTVVMRVVGLFQRRRLLFSNLEVQTNSDSLNIWLNVQCDALTGEKLLKQINRMSDVTAASLTAEAEKKFHSSFALSGKSNPGLAALA